MHLNPVCNDINTYWPTYGQAMAYVYNWFGSARPLHVKTLHTFFTRSPAIFENNKRGADLDRQRF